MSQFVAVWKFTRKHQYVINEFFLFWNESFSAGQQCAQINSKHILILSRIRGRLNLIPIVAVLTILYFIFALKWPQRAVNVFLIFLGLWPPYFVLWYKEGLPGLNPMRFMLLVLCAVWSLHFIVNRKLRFKIFTIIKAHKYLMMLIVAFFFFPIVSALLASDDKVKSIYASINQIIMYPFLFLLIISYFSDKEALYRLLVLLLLISFSTEILGIVEWFFQHNLFESFVNPATDIAELIMKGKEREGLYRVQSTFSNPLSFCEYLVFMLPISIYLIRYGKSYLIKIVSLLQTIILFVCVMMTQSRTGLFLSALLLFILAATALYKKSRLAKRLLVISAVFLIAMLTVIFAYIDPLEIMTRMLLGSSDETAISSYGRLGQLLAGYIAFLNSPIYGYGAMQGVGKIQSMAGSGLSALDNYYLTVVLESGLVGLLLLIALQAHVMKIALKVDKYADNLRLPILGLYSALSFLGLFLYQITLSFVEVYSYFYVVLGILIVLTYLHGEKPLAVNGEQYYADGELGQR